MNKTGQHCAYYNVNQLRAITQQLQCSIILYKLLKCVNSPACHVVVQTIPSNWQTVLSQAQACTILGISRHTTSWGALQGFRFSNFCTVRKLCDMHTCVGAVQWWSSELLWQEKSLACYNRHLSAAEGCCAQYVANAVKDCILHHRQCCRQQQPGVRCRPGQLEPPRS